MAVGGLSAFAALRAGDALFDVVHAATGAPTGSPAGEHVYRMLWVKIVNGELSPLSHLHEENIAETAGVSRVPVREALARLRAEGFIVREGRAIRVRPFTVADIEALYECRSLLERYIAGKVSGWAAGQVVDDLLREHEDLAGRPLASVDWLRADVRLHRTLAEQCGNAYLLEATRRIRSQMSIFLPYGLLSEENLRLSYDEHLVILDELQRRASGGAAAAMEHHIARSKERLVAILRANGFLPPA